MQISLSKIQQDLISYLGSANPKPAAPVMLVGDLVCAVYSRPTPTGTSYIHLNVELGEHTFNPVLIDTYNLPGIQETAEHQALLAELQALQQHMNRSMEPHSVYIEVAYPHRLTNLLVKAGMWITHKTTSTFTTAR